MTKKKKIYFRSDFTGEPESSSDEDDLSERDKKQGICALDPVSFPSSQYLQHVFFM